MWMHPHTIKLMETNSNTPEAKQPASEGCHPTTCSALHWMWIAPVSIAISPIGTVAFTAAFSLSFDACLILIATQVCAFALLSIISNGGE